MGFGFVASFFGKITLRTPSLYSAATLSALTAVGSALNSRKGSHLMSDMAFYLLLKKLAHSEPPVLCRHSEFPERRWRWGGRNADPPPVMQSINTQRE